MNKTVRSLTTINPLSITIYLTLLIVVVFFTGPSFLEVVELKTLDLRFKSRGFMQANDAIVLAVIDEKSLDEEGRWPWPRSKIARLVDYLSDDEAKVIGFDIGFLEPDENTGGRVIEQIIEEINKSNGQNQAIQNYLKKLKYETDNDRRLADAIQSSGAKVVLGYFFQMDCHGAGQLSADGYRRHQENVKGSRYQFIRFKSDKARKVKLIEPALPQSNITAISEATDYAGFFNMEADRDGVVRWMPAVFKYKETLYASLAVMAAGAFLDSPPSLQVADYGIESLQVDRISIPVDELGRIMINYRGGAKTYPHISVTDIIRGNVAEADLKDKIVIVGATAVGIYDLRVTPFSSVFPGVEIHANIIDNILSKNFLYQPSWTAVFDIFGIVATGFILGFILPRTGVFTGILSSLMVFGGYILVCQLFFTQKGFILNLVYPLEVLLIVYVIITAYKYLVESRQKRFIKDAFSTYLAPSVVKQLIDSPEKLVLGGEKRVITAFFSDIQSFTSIAEKLSPEKLVEILNEFLTEMTDIILKYEGTVDKFEGDAIIAFFGAPNDLENHVATACAVSIEMQKKLAKLREKWKAEGKPELMMRIGLCSGPAVVGNMGSKNRMDYTMMGDTVNIAARLEGVNKVYGTYTLISETTYRAAGEGFIFREIDKINVVGKKEPITVYQLLGYACDSDEHMTQVSDFYAQGLQAYQSQEWEQAIGFLNEVLKIAPEDGPSLSLLGRCEALRQNPPGQDWSGAFVIKHK